MKKILASFLAVMILTILSVSFITAKTDVKSSDFTISQATDFPAAVADFGIVRASDQFEVRSDYFTAVNRNVAVETPKKKFQNVQLIRSNDFSFNFSPPRYKRLNFNYGFTNEQRLDRSITVLPDFGAASNFVKRE